MSTIYEIRKANLRLLVQQRDATSIAQACGYSGPSYISQLCGRNAQRAIKEDTARKIEDSLALPKGWLDVERDAFGRDASPFVKSTLPTENIPSPVEKDAPIPIRMLDTDRFERAAELVGKFLDENGKQLPHTKFAQLVTLVYERDTDDEASLQAYIGKLYKLMN